MGSANLSNAALSEGLEWTTKISHYELPYLWRKIAGTFETYWQDEEFQFYQKDAPDRLRMAIRRERATTAEPESAITFDLRPYPFQEEILDVLAAEREVQQKYRHLVVAATGTGKTMIAAFDYARFCRELGRKPSLLFVAHREEILRQALGAFRGVLRDQNFGDLLVGGRDPEQEAHLFCSIQSYNSRSLVRRPADTFEYIVIDEFHHAAAPSYAELLGHVQPTILLGLTATPERSDQLNVLQWFDGRTSAEIRLPDAINRRLLCPFQYFGVSDSVDLNGLTWQRGGYRVFVTLQKSEEDYSPTTMYEDYLISHDQFHWQSQSNTSVESPTGQRYIHHREMNYTPLLFVRETKSLPSGLSAPYYFLGPCEYIAHDGNRPISIVWRLVHAVPARLFRTMARQNVA